MRLGRVIAALLVGGKEIPSTFHVLSVTGTRELNRIPAASIQLEDGEASKATFPASNSDSFLPGKQIDDARRAPFVRNMDEFDLRHGVQQLSGQMLRRTDAHR